MKRIRHDELRTRLIGPGRDTPAAIEEAMSCYDDCACDELRATLKDVEEILESGRTGANVDQALNVIRRAFEPSGWDDDPEFPREDWKYEVANDDTFLGYPDWVKAQREMKED